MELRKNTKWGQRTDRSMKETSESSSYWSEEMIMRWWYWKVEVTRFELISRRGKWWMIDVFCVYDEYWLYFMLGLVLVLCTKCFPVPLLGQFLRIYCKWSFMYESGLFSVKSGLFGIASCLVIFFFLRNIFVQGDTSYVLRFKFFCFTMLLFCFVTKILCFRTRCF